MNIPNAGLGFFGSIFVFALFFLLCGCGSAHTRFYRDAHAFQMEARTLLIESRGFDLDEACRIHAVTQDECHELQEEKLSIYRQMYMTVISPFRQ